MYIENLTFLHSIELFKNLEKNKLQCNTITLSFYDGSKYQYITFKNTGELIEYHKVAYKNYPIYELGNFVKLEKFKCDSNIYNFKTNFIVNDIFKNLKIMQGKDLDINRDINRNSLLNKQKELLNNCILIYKTNIIKLEKIYKNGIYSPGYAENGWSEGTNIWPNYNT